jgi:hypothetical protein
MISNSAIGMYKPTGNGRDSYISTNNGGFTADHPTHYKPNYTLNNGIHYAKLANRSHVSMYQGNGGGRDSYIYNTNGGFSNETFTNKSFFSTLRDGYVLNILIIYRQPFVSRNRNGGNSRSQPREKNIISMNWYSSKDLK